MDENEAQLRAAQVEAARERADVATRALFTLRGRLDEEAKRWAREAGPGGFLMAESLRGLAKSCDQAWQESMRANDGQRDGRSGITKGAAAPDADLKVTERGSLLKLVVRSIIVVTN